MNTGTKSVLFGAHAFWLHPFFVAVAWTRLYGFPWDPRLWVAFFVHDLGYFGSPNMDGAEGERHPEFGARIMQLIDGKPSRYEWLEWSFSGKGVPWRTGGDPRRQPTLGDPDFNRRLVDGWALWQCFNDVAVLRRPRFFWSDFVLYHSRFYAKRDGVPPSRLCAADKLALSLTPAWLYLPMARATGELAEYRQHHDDAKHGEGKYAGDKHTRSDFATSDEGWYAIVQDYCRRWAFAHREGGEDTWTASAEARVS